MRILNITDLHLGRRGNCHIHNRDVLEFLDWALGIGAQENCTHLCFLGDWHDDRTRLDARTLNYSQEALEKIENAPWLLKAWFLIGNHDLFYRHNRKTHSLPHTSPLKKIILVNQPYREDDMLFLPYLFEHEYNKWLNTDAKYVFGHLEFKGFVVTGSSGFKMKSGPSSDPYQGPDLILSGHFHKRQAKGNMVYIGNGFPMDFGDAGDVARGCAILDTEKEGDDRLEFFDWPECPRYIRCMLEETLNDPDKILYPKARVRCLMDIDITYDEALYITETFVSKYKLREFRLEDPQVEDLTAAMSDDQLAAQNIDLANMDDVILGMLGEVEAPGIDNEKLKALYREL